MKALPKRRRRQAPDVACLTAVSGVLVLCVCSFVISFFQTNKISYRKNSAIYSVITAKNGSTSTIVVEELDDNVSDITKYAACKEGYSWVGNRWLPPPGVPYLSPNDILLLFQTENTLWWGDSTGRQDYQTMYHMLNADDIHNVHSLELELDRNKGRGGRQAGITFHCPTRIPKDLFFADLGQEKGTNCSNSSSSIGKLDLLVYSTNNNSLMMSGFLY